MSTIPAAALPVTVSPIAIGPGTTNRLTSNVDLVPTLLAWAKTSAPAGFVDGASWAANARGATAGATFPAEVLLRGCRTGKAGIVASLHARLVARRGF